ncbi:MAG: TRAM domain-containing protein, partial [Calditrichaeota bacterium]
TDVIVGFPTETDADFEETVEVVREVKFDSAFIFKYSERKNTIAYKNYPDDVPPEVKTDRIVRLFELQKEITYRKNLEAIGRQVAVLVEGPSKKRPEEWMGRTDGNKIVVFPQVGVQAGEMVTVEITAATPHTLVGEVVEQPVALAN